MEKKETIKSIAYDQHEILYNVMQMHNDGKPFEMDFTYSKGAFYGTFNITTIDGERRTVEIPKPKYCLDVCPQQDDTIKIEPLGNLPFEDNSIESINFDPPFVISCGPSMNTPDFDEHGRRVKNNMISRRFASYYPVAQLLESYHHWMSEIYRVLKPDGIACVKCQKTITGSKALNSPEYLWFLAESIGLDMIDSFMLLAKARIISGKINKQMHSRRFESEFLVFKKSLSKKISYLSFADDALTDKLLDGFRRNNVARTRKTADKVERKEEKADVKEEMKEFVWDGEDTVDLGLPSGTIWQTYNLGGSKPEDFGLYYQWGDTKGYTGACAESESDSNPDKHYFNWSKYKWCEGSSTTMTKYCTRVSDGNMDDKKVLDDEDDAVYVASGGEFRMPTAEEMYELIENCDSRRARCNGVEGTAFISKINGKGIFFPASGLCYTSRINSVGTYAYCWTSSLGATLSSNARGLYSDSTNTGTNLNGRYFGCPIRGVK